MIPLEALYGLAGTLTLALLGWLVYALLFAEDF